MNSEPTNGEVLRRLDQVSRELHELALQMREDRNKAEATYVRQDVFKPMLEASLRRIETLENEQDAREKAGDAFRRQIIAGLILLGIPALASLVLALNNLTAGVAP